MIKCYGMKDIQLPIKNINYANFDFSPERRGSSTRLFIPSKTFVGRDATT